MPVPDVVHCPVVVATDTDAFIVADIVPAHKVWSGPALTTGAGVIVTVISSAIEAQPPVEVNVIVMNPFAVSAALGIYVVERVEAVGEKVPVPAVVHIPAAVVDVPMRETVSAFAQTV